MKIECKKALINPMMFISVFITFIILLRVFFIYDLFNTTMDYLTMFTYPIALSGFLPFAALLAILPYAFSYLEEKNSGYGNYIISRCGIKKYIVSKVMSVGVAGGVAMTIPFILIIVIVLINGASVTRVNYPEMYEGRRWEPYLLIWGGKFILLLRLVLIFMFGAAWAEIALFISACYSNRYVVFIMTFVCYQLMWMILPTKINMTYLFRADYSQETMSIYTPYLIWCVYILVVCLFNYLIMIKKVKV